VWDPGLNRERAGCPVAPLVFAYVLGWKALDAADDAYAALNLYRSKRSYGASHLRWA